MPIPILMPALSPTMEEGNLVKWHVKEGDAVASGDVLAEIETDKAVMEVEAVDEGTIGRIMVASGTEGVKVNVPIAIILEEGESADDIESMVAAASPGAEASSQGGAPSAGVVEPAGPGPASGAMGQSASANIANGQRLAASPLARRLAKTAQIDIAAISGSGPHGRIVKRDIEAALKNGAVALATTSTSVATRPPVSSMSDDKILALYEQDSYELKPHDNMRRTIATRLVEAKTTIPHFYLTIECQLDELLRARKRMNEGADGKFKLSVNDFIIKALALALQAVPDANATWTEAGRLMHQRSDVGVAVAIEGGLFTPIIRHADLKTLSEISNEIKDLAARARNRRLAPHEYQGGTSSISNLGMYGIKSFDAVINPPHATILAVGAGVEQAVVIDGAINVATIMSCTLSCDHRVVDGALGADLLKAFKNYIEDPVRMLI